MAKYGKSKLKSFDINDPWLLPEKLELFKKFIE